jgi:hypothetical protein
MYRSIVFLLTALVVSTGAQAAKTYTWVDENGVTHFSTRQPPRENADQTKLQGGSVTQPRTSAESEELAKIRRQNLRSSGWQDCDSSLCQLVEQIDPNCETSFCSRAKQYSSDCASMGCQTKKLAFEKDMRDRLAAQTELQNRQAINANATPTAPASQNQD